MHIKVTNGVSTPYSVAQLKRDNPQVSFPQNPSDELLAEYGVFALQMTQRPLFNAAIERVTESTPKLIRGKWIQTWAVTALTPDEIAQQNADRQTFVEEQRADAYRAESDPLFFKAQRGEATHQEWLDKVAEIKARFQ